MNKLASVTIDGQTLDILASKHADVRMKQRKVDAFVVAGSVLALGPERIAQLQQEEDNAMIIDKANNVAVVVDFAQTEIIIVTVINKSNVFVKENTSIYQI